MLACIFEKNKYQCFDYEDDTKCLIGGSGYDLSVKLPEEINQVKPKINLGFTTRGCIRNCQFCIVPKKEGRIKIVGDLLDLWDGKSKDVTLLDNNILAIPNHFKAICRIYKFYLQVVYIMASSRLLHHHYQDDIFQLFLRHN